MVDARLARGVAPALVIVELSILFGPPPLRVAAGLLLGLVLPGLVLARLVSWPRKDGVEKLLLVPGMSVVIAIITGVVMTAAHIRLTTVSWAIALGVVTAVGIAIIAVLDRSELGGHDDYADAGTPPGSVANGRGPIPVFAFAAMLVVAALAVAGALVISSSGERYRGRGFTELWALPDRSSASAIRLGVLSHEVHDVRYTLRISIDGRAVRSQQITIRPLQTWQSMQAVANPADQVEISLQKWPSHTVYRQVHVSAGELRG